MKTRTAMAAVCAAIVGALAIAACGGSSDANESTPTTAEQTIEEAVSPSDSAPAATVEEPSQPVIDETTEPTSTMDDTMEHDPAMDEASDGGAGGHEHGEGVEAPTGMSVSVEALEDSKSGYNLKLTTNEFTFAPENVGTDHVAGEGHAHVYVDGEKLGRIYGEWFHLDNLEPGTHEIRVTLNANTHSDYTTDGETIAATINVGDEAVEAAEAVEAVEPPAEPKPEPVDPPLQEIVIENGEPIGGVTRIEGKKGDTIAFAVRSDIPEEVHVHGFDVTKTVDPGSATKFKFKAAFEGIFEVEAHNAGNVVIAKVVVSP